MGVMRAAQSVIRAGSARITPMAWSGRASAGAWLAASVRLVEVAALQEEEVPVVVLDVEVQLEVVLDDLRGHVALRSGVVGEGEDDQIRVLARDGLHASRIGRGLLRVLRDERHE